jgi:hypothetical protein
MTLVLNTRDGRDVEAQVLVGVDGNVVYDAVGAPLVAPLDYNPEDAANAAIANANEYFQTSYSVLYQFRTDHPLDLQRNYNGVTQMGGNGFVAEFTPVASYSLGYTGAALGVDLATIIAGGGGLNVWNKHVGHNANIDDSGLLGNNPKNVKNIIKGYQDYLRLHAGGKGSLVQPPKCFPSDTMISLENGNTKPISEIRVGDVVMSFDPAVDGGRGALVPKRVKRLFRNTTTEWIKLTWLENGEAKELVATPGHHMLDKTGAFTRLDLMMQNGKAEIVLASGEVVEANAEHITYSAETAHLFEQAGSSSQIAINGADGLMN